MVSMDVLILTKEAWYRETFGHNKGRKPIWVSVTCHLPWQGLLHAWSGCLCIRPFPLLVRSYLTHHAWEMTVSFTSTRQAPAEDIIRTSHVSAAGHGACCWLCIFLYLLPAQLREIYSVLSFGFNRNLQSSAKRWEWEGNISQLNA